MATNDLLKTPQEFIDKESENIKTYLSDHSDVQVNKLGIIGFVMNLLGNIRYDALHYYQNLFIESNVSTSRDENNLYMHSSLYGYTPGLATPSEAEGTFVFDFANLTIDNSSAKRTVTFKSVTFKIDDIEFSTNTVYKFVQESGANYYAIVYLEDGTIHHIPASSSVITVPFFNVHQKTEETETLTLSNYDYYTYYTTSFTTDDQYLSSLSVYVKEYGIDYVTGSIGDEYDVKSIKYLESAFSKSCFLKINSSNTYKLEFGSGIRGNYIPKATVTIIKNITYGASGHISVESTLTPEGTSEIILRTYSDLSSTDHIQHYLSSKLVTVNFTSSSQGTNPKTGNDLRKEITTYIQSREFLIDKQDYENLTNVDDNEFVYSFKKTSIQRNDFYLYQVLRDENQVPVKSFCVNFPIIDIVGSVQNLTSTKIIESDGGLNTANTYVYSIHASDGFHISAISTITTTLTIENAVELNWDSYDYAQIYIISVYDGSAYRYFSSYDTTFTDIGQLSDNENNFVQETVDTDVLTPTYSWQDSYIFFPEFELNETVFVSPFIYKYNSFMNWFEGYLFYDDFVVLFTQADSSTTTEVQNYTVPHFHLRIKYNYVNKITRLTVISPQDCTNFTGKITVSGTSIISEQVTRLTTNTFYVDYDENDYGMLFDEHTIDFNIYSCNNDDFIDPNVSALSFYTTVEFKQLESIKDQMKLVKYIDETDNTHLLSVPVLEKTVYETDIESYNLKLLSSVYETNLSDKRFPNDEIQYRFLNTYFIGEIYLRSILKQTYEFTLYFPLLLTVNIIFDSTYIDNTVIDLTTEKNSLYLAIANKLQDDYTGHIITFYNSHMIDFVRDDRLFVKDVTVSVTDSNLNPIAYGIEVNDEDTVMENIQSDSFDTDEGNTKTNITYYNPAYFWWDVDNITINYIFN